MATVIAVCGAGGKTTFCLNLAKKYIKLNKKVCITTTTHMWNMNSISDINKLTNIMPGIIYYFGLVRGEKIGAVSYADYLKICNVFDYVIIEADGSHMMPLKIPIQWTNLSDERNEEPVIPENVNEIVVVMGNESIGREFLAVCQHSNEISDKIKFDNLENADDIVTYDLIDEIISKCYIEPLQSRFNDANISVYKVDFAVSGNYKKIKNLAIVLCASGFSKRFGIENKLLTNITIPNTINDVDGYNNVNKNITEPLYKLMIDKLFLTRNLLIAKFNNELKYNNLIVDIAVVSQHNEILDDIEYKDKVVFLRNNFANLGLSSSIKLAAKHYENFDAIMYMNADLPMLPPREICNFLYYSICSNNNISSMFTDIPQNPAYIEKELFDEVESLEGDEGLKKLLFKYKKESYKYFIDNKYLYDIDTKDDLKNLIVNYKI